MKASLKSEGRPLAWYAGMSLLMFGFIFDFYLHAFGIPTSITPSRIAAVAITIIAIHKTTILKKRKNIFEAYPGKILKQICWFHVPIIVYMLFLYMAIGVQGDSRHMFVIILYSAIFKIIPIWAFYECFDSLEELMKVLVLTMLIQTGFIWLCITTPSIKVFIDSTFHLSETYLYYGDTYAGGLGCIASQGLIRYAVGEVACVYLFFRNNNILYLIILLIFGLTGTMIVRTGLVVFAICVLFLLYFTLKKHKTTVFFSLLATTFLVFIVTSVILNSNSSRKFLEGRFVRLEYLFEDVRYANDIYDIGFFDEYMHGERTVLPPISSETIVGTGVPSGTSGNGITVNVDGGFFRLYVAYGLILCIIFYIFFFSRLFNVCNYFKIKETRYTMFLMLTLIIVSELKEWNIYSSCHVTIFFLMALLSYQDMKIKSSYIKFKK